MPSNKHLLAILTLTFAAIVAGCQTVNAPNSTLPRLGGNEPMEQLEFWHALATKSLISNDEAFHGLLLDLDGKDAATSYEQRVALLKSRNLLSHSFNQPADQALGRGTISIALVHMLDIKGGLTMRLFGATEHYATRELEYRDIYPRSSDNQIFTGSEFVGGIGKAEDIRHGDPTNLPASVVLVDPNDDPQPPDDAITPILAMIAPDLPDLSLSPSTTQAASRPAGPFKVIITDVEGLASVRADEGSPWVPAKKGMEFGEKAEFRTGPRGTVQFVIPPDQTVSVDRLTTLKVLKVVEQGRKVTTDLGIKYGRTRYDLEGGGLEHQSTLRSPNATLAVRGTKVSLFDQPPYAPQAVSLTGRAEFQAFHRGMIAFGNHGQGKTVVNSTSNTAGDLALSQTVIDPTLQGARTESEAVLLTTFISRGATASIDRGTGIVIVHGGVPPTDAQLIPALPGRLDFVLRWNGNANLDLGVSTPATAKNPGGEFIYPAAGLNIAPSGVKSAFDHQGGPNGGLEIVYFDKFVNGVYGLGGPDITKGTVVTATLEAFLDGKHVPMFDGLTSSDTITQTVSSSEPALGLAFVNTPVPSTLVPQSLPVKSSAAGFVGPLPMNASGLKKK